MSNIPPLPERLELAPDYGGLPGIVFLRFTCPQCGQSVTAELSTLDLLGPLCIPCTNPGCPGYTLAITHSFGAFGLVTTGAPPEITLFDAETEAQQLRETVRSQAERDVWEREFASMSWTVADILDEDFGMRPDDPRWTPERAAQLLEKVSDDLVAAMTAAGREVLEFEIIHEDARQGFEKCCPHCGSTDVQFYGKQAVEVIEDWSEEDSRDNFEFPEGPGQWLSCTGHCLTCGEEWEVIPDSNSE